MTRPNERAIGEIWESPDGSVTQRTGEFTYKFIKFAGGEECENWTDYFSKRYAAGNFKDKKKSK